MSHAERTGVRSLVYSGWHRPVSISRYVGKVAAAKLCMIDVDACEYCCYCGTPLALIETQESAGPPKSARVMTALARLASIPAFSVSVDVLDGDVAGFRLRQLGPAVGSDQSLTPAMYADWLVSLRDEHVCKAQAAA